MRLLIISAIIALVTSSCSDQERIDQYEKQLKESNEALEEVIDYRRNVMRRRAAENPAKALEWKDLSEHYYKTSYSCITNFNDQTYIDSLVKTLDFHEDFNRGKWDSVAAKLKSLSPNDSSIARNLILNELNRTLQSIAYYSNTTFCGFRMPYVFPKIFPSEDSTLVLLTSNFHVQTDDFVIDFDKPLGQNLKPINTLGYFFLPNDYTKESLTGTVSFMDDDGLQSWQVKFSKDSIYEPISRKTP